MMRRAGQVSPLISKSPHTTDPAPYAVVLLAFKHMNSCQGIPPLFRCVLAPQVLIANAPIFTPQTERPGLRTFAASDLKEQGAPGDASGDLPTLLCVRILWSPPSGPSIPLRCTLLRNPLQLSSFLQLLC